jgi:hypothetical protein
MRGLLLLWRVGRQDLRLLWFALRHPNRPAWLLPIAALLGLFALEPANFAIPMMRAIADLLLLPERRRVAATRRPLLGDLGRF